MTNNYRWIVLIALSIMLFIINVDYTAINLALIPMAHDMNTSLNTIQWVLSGYVLAWAVLVIPAGKYIDRYQKKNVCLLGLIIFLLGSLLAGIAQSADLLISARIFQGIGGAIYVPALYALIYIHFAEHERGIAIGLMSIGVGLGLAIGPVLGGMSITYLNWRGIFLINIPIGLIALLIIMSDKNREQTQSAINPVCITSTLLLSVFTIITIYLLSQWQSWSQKSDLYLLLSLLAFAAFTLFIIQQRKSATPLIPLTLFNNLSFSACIIGIFLEQYGFSTIIVSSGLYLQKILQFSAIQSCLIYLSLTIIFGLIAALGGAWVDRVGLKKPTVLGLFIIAIASLLFALFTEINYLWFTCLIFLLFGIGMGLAFAGLNTGIVKVISQEKIGIATSIFLMFALLGNSFGVTITTMIYERSSIIQLLQTLQNFGKSINSNQLQQLNNFIANIGSNTPDLASFDMPVQHLIMSHATNALSHGLSNAMLINFILSMIACICCINMLRRSI